MCERKRNNTGCISRHGHDGDATQSKRWNKEYMHECGDNVDTAPNWYHSNTTMKMTQALLMKTVTDLSEAFAFGLTAHGSVCRRLSVGGVGSFGFLLHGAVIGYGLGRDTHEILTFSINTDSLRGFAFSILIYFIIFSTKQL